jgi:hypothetical protein
MDGHHSKQNVQSLERNIRFAEGETRMGWVQLVWEIVHVWPEAASFLRLLRICTRAEGGERRRRRNEAASDDDEFEKAIKQNQRKKMKVMAAYIGRAMYNHVHHGKDLIIAPHHFK